MKSQNQNEQTIQTPTGKEVSAVFFCDLDADQMIAARESSCKSGVLRMASTPNEETSLAREMYFNQQDGNLRLEIKNGTGGSLKTVDDVTADLIACACHLYQGDQLKRRSEKAWARNMEYHIAVRDPKLWKDQIPKLKELIRILTGDTISIDFYQLTLNRSELQLPELIGQYDGGVCVFLNDFDSIAGATVVSNSNPIVASYRFGPGYPLQDQQTLMKLIAGSIKKPLHHIGFGIQAVNLNARDSTRRTRGFLQLALAAAVARSAGLDVVNKIQIFGNGVSSHLFEAEQLCGGGRSVRDTYPEVLRRAQILFRGLFAAPQPISIVNPFQFFTPAMVIQELKSRLHSSTFRVPKKRRPPLSAHELFTEANACWDPGLAKLFSVAHCGCCFPCKIRRLTALIVGFEKEDNYSAYAIDPLKAEASAREKKKLQSRPFFWQRYLAFHEDGYPQFKRYIRTFLKKDNEILQDLTIGPAIDELARLNLNLSGDETVATNMKKEMIAVHRQFATEAKRYLH